MEEQYFGAGRESANKKVEGVCEEKPKTFMKNGVEISTDKKTRSVQGLGYFFGGMLGSLLSFEFAYWVISHFDVNHLDVPGFLIKSVVAVAFSVFVIKSWDGSTGNMPTLMSKPVAYFTVIIFVLSLFIGYNQDNGRGMNGLDNILLQSRTEQLENTSGTEFGVINLTDQVWRTSRSFKAGTTVFVRIKGGCVKTKNGSLLKASEFMLPILTDGTVAFIGVKDTPVTIEVVL